MSTPVYSQPSDGLRRTEFFGPEVLPTIPGNYECSTGSGFVFTRRWDGTNWISSVNGTPSTVRMMWRGVEPGSISPKDYPREYHGMLNLDIELRLLGENGVHAASAPHDHNDPNIAAALAA